MGLHGGRCACGAVTFTADVVGTYIGACHCGTCRRLNAGPFLCVEARELAVADGAPVAVYASSDWADRPFCARCGTTLGYRLKGTDKAWVAAYVFDPPLDLPMTSEVYIDEKPAHYEFAGLAHRLTGAELMAMVAKGEG